MRMQPINSVEQLRHAIRHDAKLEYTACGPGSGWRDFDTYDMPCSELYGSGGWIQVSADIAKCNFEYKSTGCLFRAFYPARPSFFRRLFGLKAAA